MDDDEERLVGKGIKAMCLVSSEAVALYMPLTAMLRQNLNNPPTARVRELVLLEVPPRMLENSAEFITL